MSYSGGTFSINSSGQPVVTGTVISSTAFNALTADLATGLSTCILKDGTQTLTGNIPMAGFVLTGLGAGSSNGQSVRYEQINGIYQLLSTYTTAGDIVQATGSAVTARLGIGTARQVPTVNAGATALAYQNPITLATEQASTSGTSIDFTGIPAGVQRITVMLVGVSTNGSTDLLIQLGDSGGIESSGYLGSASRITNVVQTSTSTAGFVVTSGNSAGSAFQGSVTFTLERASTFMWTSQGVVNDTSGGATIPSGGSKATSAILDRVRITTVNGSDAFDAGVINISYE